MAAEGVRVRQVEIATREGPARAHVGGSGSAVLLVHGGWAGAEVHWSRVWEALAEHHQVIAPELPGLGAIDQPARASVSDYVTWLTALLDALEVPSAWCVGNSFGGTVVLSLAGRAPERSAGLVIVNGLMMGRTPQPLYWAGRTRPGRALMRAMLLRASYNEQVVPRAFADSRHIPDELLQTLEGHGELMADRFAALLVAGDAPPRPHCPTLVLWGEDDQLVGTSGPRAALKVQGSLPGSTLRVIPSAGHFPQLEAPVRFTEELESFFAAHRAQPQDPLS